jgi:hypothetical protein
MIQIFAHNILLSAMVAALLLLLPAAVEAQQVEVEQPDEIISVSSRVAHLSVAVSSLTRPAPAGLRWEVRHDARAVDNLTVDAPGDSNPLSLVIVVDLAAGKGGQTYSSVRRQLEALPSRLHLKAVPRVFVAAAAGEQLPLRWPSAWPTAYAGDVRAALNSAMDAVESSPGSRRALLLLTNRVEDLPPYAFEAADARLRESASLVCLLTFKRPDVKYGGPNKDIARSNLKTREHMIIYPSADLVETQFKFFARLANSMYVLSYPLAQGDSTPGEHTAEVRALDAARGDTFITQRRTFKIN